MCPSNIGKSDHVLDKPGTASPSHSFLWDMSNDVAQEQDLFSFFF